jgi:phosphoenolpyruvate carboxykinase (ATP)
VYKYEALLERVVKYLNQKEESTLYVQDVYAGRDPSFAVPFRFVGECATHALFAHTMFPKDVKGIADHDKKRWTMLNVPSFRTDPDWDGSRSDAAIIVDFRRRIALVAGPADYCGTVKKTMFTIMNFMLPDLGYLSMHSSAKQRWKGRQRRNSFWPFWDRKYDPQCGSQPQTYWRRRNRLDEYRNIQLGRRVLRKTN